MDKKRITIMLYIALTFFLFYPPSAVALEAVASIKALKGTVNILRNSSTFSARAGLILHDKDLVITYPQSKATIQFRDGSEIRLFSNTKFLIEKSVEAPTGPRRFLHNIILKVGSFWGKFTKSRQRTMVKTPTATIGIKGTTFVLTERNKTLDVSLSTGEISLTNQVDSVELSAGKMIKNVTAAGTIADKIVDLPYLLTINPDHTRIEIPEPGKEKQVYFTLQLVDLKTNKNIDRPGDVYISAATDKLEFDDTIRLNNRGYARVKATLKSFESTSLKNGQFEIFAFMDDEAFTDVVTGKSILAYVNPHILKIEASSGKVE